MAVGNEKYANGSISSHRSTNFERKCSIALGKARQTFTVECGCTEINSDSKHPYRRKCKQY